MLNVRLQVRSAVTPDVSPVDFYQFLSVNVVIRCLYMVSSLLCWYYLVSSVSSIPFALHRSLDGRQSLLSPVTCPVSFPFSYDDGTEMFSFQDFSQASPRLLFFDFCLFFQSFPHLYSKLKVSNHLTFIPYPRLGSV